MIGGLIAVLTGHLIESAKLKAIAIALYAAAAVSLLFASVFGLVALRHWIAVTYLTAYPDLWIALGFLVIAAPLIGFGVYMQQKRPKANPAADIVLIAGPPALRLAARRLNPRTVGVGAVLIAGLLLGRRYATRRSTA